MKTNEWPQFILVMGFVDSSVLCLSPASSECLPTHMPPNIASSHQKVKWELEAPEKADIAEMASQTSPVLPLFRLKVALMISYALEAEHFG
ncbi:uncharacterized protein A4U43_C03F520 [Asparagus officinalis]|uniref:Uncharacterized protein n=1 Tax=Asparagus officinalis TaxID=4686 RepID=A0A5P1FBG7_ASPOF|nr:uncharacterized protein A4U43_C03F520 [Asparagus officinalis]